MRSQQARAENLGPLDFISYSCTTVATPPRPADWSARQGRRISRQRTLDTFDWKFNTLDRALIFELANCRFIEQHEDILLLGNAGVGKSHIAQALGMAAIVAGFRVLYREAHVLFEDMLLATRLPSELRRLEPTARFRCSSSMILGKRKLPANAAEDLLEIIMRRYERGRTILTSNRPLDDWPNSSVTCRRLRRFSIASCTTAT